MPWNGGKMEKNHNQNIREYIDRLFEDAPKTRAALELKEEISTNAEEKYADLLAQGYKAEDALEVVLHSIGNVEDLFHELEQADESSTAYMGLTKEEQKKKALITAIAVGLYIFAGVIFFFFGMLQESGIQLMNIEMTMLGFVLAALICIIPTGMLVYTSMMQPRYKKKEENMVEDYKEWKSGSSRSKEIRKAISSIVWTLGVVFYFLWSFSTGAWHISWVTFLILGCIESIIGLAFSLHRDGK